MKLPFDWAKDLVKFKYNAEELAQEFNLHSFEVASVTDVKSKINNVVTGKILEIKKHPGADRLRICQVDMGKTGKVQIVTAAENVREQMIVPVALDGALLPSGMQIKTSKLRGETSQGMMCSEKELGLAADAQGIMDLPKNTEIGKAITEAIDFPSAVLEIEILPNRPDCLSVIGLAREISAFTGNALKIPKLNPVIKKGTSLHKPRIALRDWDNCIRYMARLIEGVEVKASPAWLQNRLKSVGITPINNIVDVTNYVMMESGQPLHAFDFELLEGGQINVRTGYKNEKISLLNGQEIEVSENVLLIADKNKPVALAGIMGGSGTAISNKTKVVLLESAFFAPDQIKKTVKKFDVRSESSMRFEKGVHFEGVEWALNRAINLIIEIAGGEVVTDLIDEKRKNYEPIKLSLRYPKIKRILGIEIPEKDVQRILTDLEFKIEDMGDRLNVFVPSHRSGDVTREIDLIEEIARIYGISQIPTHLPELPIRILNEAPSINEKIGQALQAQGFYEALNLPFSAEMNQLNQKDLKLANPLNENEKHLRDQLLPGLLKNLSYNLNHQNDSVKLYEIGKVYLSDSEEDTHIAGIISDEKFEFLELKGVLENLIENLSYKVPGVEVSSHSYLHPGKQANFKTLDLVFGEIHPETLARFDIKFKKAFAFEGSLSKFNLLKKEMPIFSELPKFFHSRRDVAIQIKVETTHEEIIRAMKSAAAEEVDHIECFDVYTGEQIKEGFKSMAYAIYYRHPERTLTEEEINTKHAAIQTALKQKLAAEIR